MSIETIKGYKARNRRRYPKVYVGNGHYERLNRLVWEAAFGPIAAGYIVHHRNGDVNDNSLENLQLLPGRDHSADHLRVWQKSRALRFGCAAPNCKRPHHAHGLCMFHYDQSRRQQKRANDLARYYRLRKTV